MSSKEDVAVEPTAGAAEFAWICCAHGAESVVKQEVAEQGWRLAFSRPGFVTLKRELSSHPARGESLPQGVFVRTAAHSLGQVRADTSAGSATFAEMLASLEEQLTKGLPDVRPFDQLHVWPKDRAPIGRFDFEPGVDEVSRAVAHELVQGLGERRIRCHAANQIAESGERVLDVVLVTPTHWFLGWHTASTWPTRWPGGVQPIDPALPPVSRAYYKAAEAIQWSGFDIRPGDLAIEIGSAPGGACQRLLELGLQVIGIDPAEMDPRVAEHPRFQHIQARAEDLPRRQFRGASWLLVDSTVKPEQTLTAVGAVVTHRESDLRGLLLTLKLGDYAAASKRDSWRRTIERWGRYEIRMRQLARNRCEICFAVDCRRD